MTDTHRRENIASILSDDVTVRYGDAAWREAVETITTVADSVATTFGPYGHDKLIVDNGGNVEVTSETVSILRRLHLTNPVARIVRDVANTQLFKAGDGTTATVVLTGALVERADELVEQGLHPTTISNGFGQAADVASNSLSTLVDSHDITDREVCESVAETVISGTNTAFASPYLAGLTVDAVAHVTDERDVNLNALRVRSDRGNGIEQTALLRGAVVDAVPDRSSQSIAGANILLVDGTVEPVTTQRETGVEVRSSTDLESIRQVAEERTTELVRRLSDLDVDLLVADGISDSVRRALDGEDVLCLTGVSDADRRFLLETLQATPVADVMEATEADVATADVSFNHDETYSVVTTEDSETVTLHLRSSSEKQLDELESIIDKAVEVVAQVAADGRVVPGGCAAEEAMAMAIRDRVPSIDGREQLAAFAFADALESLPRALARNAGLDETDQLLSLRKAHDDGRRSTGINVETATLEEMPESGILEPVVVKERMLSNVRQAVNTIVRIDGIIEEPETESRSGSV